MKSVRGGGGEGGGGRRGVRNTFRFLPSPWRHLLPVYENTLAKVSVHSHLKSFFEIVQCEHCNVCCQYYPRRWVGFMTCTTSHATLPKNVKRLNSFWNLFRMTSMPRTIPSPKELASQSLKVNFSALLVARCRSLFGLISTGIATRTMTAGRFARGNIDGEIECLVTSQHPLQIFVVALWKKSGVKYLCGYCSDTCSVVK